MRRAFFIICGAIIVAYAAYTVHVIEHPYLARDLGIRWSSMPPAAQETVMTHADGGQINEITKSVRNSKVYYGASVKTPAGEEIMLKVEETGKLIGLRYKDDSDPGCKTDDVRPYSYPTR